MKNTIIVLDFGGQYAQLIARRVRESNVYSELFPWNAPQQEIMSHEPKGFILSGGPNSIYERDAPQLPEYILESGLPLLGICYGMCAITQALGGIVEPAREREYGQAASRTLEENPLLEDGEHLVWMSHGDRIEALPPGFTRLAESENSPIAAMGHLQKRWYGLQFHPEVLHTSGGKQILERFVLDICAAAPDWTPGSVIEASVAQIRAQVGDQKVLAAVSGGVDSSVAAALVHKAVGDQLSAVFVDHGLLRKGEAAQVVSAFRQGLGVELVAVDAKEDFLDALKGVVDPERKRKIIGERFIRLFEQQAEQMGSPPFLVQGTIYPDVIESRAPERGEAHLIKTHHNVGGLPEDHAFELVEPLRYLFKDEIRRLGHDLGLPDEILWRQPFPGPGLAIRCLGEVTEERLRTLKEADAIFTEELDKAGLLRWDVDGEGQGSSQ
ncbi:MAG: glutamine-hydrolyzing GMP synthase, partial [Anaerolineae bacterium]|nr:glutamine-hydrolyzing GMP synthase [Anaerolineae bacterium]